MKQKPARLATAFLLLGLIAGCGDERNTAVKPKVVAPTDPAATATPAEPAKSQSAIPVRRM